MVTVMLFSLVVSNVLWLMHSQLDNTRRYARKYVESMTYQQCPKNAAQGIEDVGDAIGYNLIRCHECFGDYWVPVTVGNNGQVLRFLLCWCPYCKICGNYAMKVGVTK